jgi:succinate dehydrogenase / fumarate reductase iron-sulfur subunit
MNARQDNEIIFRIRRFEPDRSPRPFWQEFRIAGASGMTVLDGLWTIKETADPSLSWRSSCRMGICGSCGMIINGRPRLACNTQISELGGSRIAVAPLPNFDIVRDLVPDLTPMFDSHTALKPHIIRDDGAEMERPTGEFLQLPEQLRAFLQFSYCIKCGCCMAACPTYATDPVYHGPMPLSQAHRYDQDNRDAGFRDRREALAGERGPWRCHYAGECSRVCPKGVDPARAIQFLRRQLVLDAFGLGRKQRPAKVAPKPSESRREDIPEAPARTV